MILAFMLQYFRYGAAPSIRICGASWRTIYEHLGYGVAEKKDSYVKFSTDFTSAAPS